MTHVQTRSVVLIGTQGHPITVEADLHDGDPHLDIIGLPPDQLRETRDRLRAAVFNSGLSWPHQRLTVGLFAACMPKAAPLLDLPIAAAILAAAEMLPPDEIADRMLIGELSLDGRLRPARGVLPAVLAAADAGVARVVIPAANAIEATLAPGMTVDAVPDLAALVRLLRGQEKPTVIQPAPQGSASTAADNSMDLADAPIGSRGRLAAEVAAAGGHHLLLTGGTRSGARILAEGIPRLLPSLTDKEALEVTAIHSAAGSLPARPNLITRPPSCVPHRSTTTAALFGTWTSPAAIRPGIASQAHRGLLLLTDAPEFARDVLQGLGQPLSLGHIQIPTWATSLTLPADFQLVLTSRPCPCQHAAGGTTCACTPQIRRLYLSRIPTAVREHCDLRVALPRVQPGEPHPDRGVQESTAAVAARVAQARQAMTSRLRRTPWRRNAQLPRPILDRFWPLPHAVLRAAQRARPDTDAAARAEATRILRIAWTLADLSGFDRPGIDQVDLAHDLNTAPSDT
ncbi:YifB family Mg chelatase-like AAA ATPase [Parafrankia elaeagni]|uniref:YifB family Mg chelatase-like AAA ATPase n=1 Tax=Parafrankia elaeagni TaxID=222534 RepID=UPI00036B29B5|nr:ATP-binding protein [Parafrankia elaeagni]